MDQLVTSFCCKIHKYSFVAHSELVKVIQSCPTLCNPKDYRVHGILQASRILQWVAFPTSRGSSQSRDWTQVSSIAGRFSTSWATGKPKNTGVVAYPFSSRSSWPRNQTRVSCIAGRFFTNWAIREAPIECLVCIKYSVVLSWPSNFLFNFF